MLHLKINGDGYDVFVGENVRDQKHLGFIKNQDEFNALMSEALQKCLVIQSDYDYFCKNFSASVYFLKNHNPCGAAKGTFIDPGFDSQKIVEELEMLTKDSFKKMDEAQRRSWQLSYKTFLGAATG